MEFQSDDVNPYQAPETVVARRRAGSGAADLASRWARLGAAIIDGLIGLFLIVPVQYAMGVFDNFPDIKEPEISQQLLLLMFGVAVFLLLHGYLMSTRGQTIGKALVNIRMVRTDGSVADLNRLIGLRYAPQWAVAMIPVAGVILPLVDVLFIFRADKRCIHDLIAGTKVVNVAVRRPAAAMSPQGDAAGDETPVS